MQLVLSNNRIIAHGENFLSMGGVVINTETGAKYENATVAECEGCPSDIDKVGYEYHAGVFTPCAPYGVGDNNGYFMEVCSTCATPRSSGIPIKGGLGRENLSIFPLVWENASPTSSFKGQTISLNITDYVGFIIVAIEGGITSNVTGYFDEQSTILGANIGNSVTFVRKANSDSKRTITVTEDGIEIDNNATNYLIPIKVYGVKL